MTVEALAAAKDNLAKAGLAHDASVLAADGRALPFATGVFDGVSHADVFC